MPPLTLSTGKFLLTYQEKIGKGKREMEKKIRKIVKGKGENWKLKGKVKEVKGYENEQRAFFSLLLLTL